MKVKYNGPSPEVNVGGFGVHTKNEVKDYPDAVGAELVATGKKQQFEAIDDKKGKKDKE
jgi:hypothetical protein